MKKTLIAILAIVGLCVLIGQGQADEITVAWDANNPSPEGYKLFQRTEGQAYDYDKPVYTGAAATATIDLEHEKTYYFVVRAYSGEDQSGDSNEITHTTPAESNADQLCFNISLTPPKFYFNKDKTIFHGPGCRHARVVPENAATQNDIDACLAAGTCRACKICKGE